MITDTPPALGIARVRTVAFSGIDVKDVDVQVQISAGLPAFTIVGLPDKAVAESRERVRSALGALGLGLPPKRITINLSPADLAKEGSHFDLPIAPCPAGRHGGGAERCHPGLPGAGRAGPRRRASNGSRGCCRRRWRRPRASSA